MSRTIPSIRAWWASLMRDIADHRCRQERLRWEQAHIKALNLEDISWCSDRHCMHCVRERLERELGRPVSQAEVLREMFRRDDEDE